MSNTCERIIELSHCGIVGISEELEIFGGYDEQHSEADAIPDAWIIDYKGDKELPPSEKIKLAEFMIGRWTRYKKTVESRIENEKMKDHPDLFSNQ